MNTIHFVLCPDKSCARLLRRHVATQQAALYFQVGTWIELLALARKSYCLPEKSTDWEKTVISAMRQWEVTQSKTDKPPVWSASFDIAEQAVGALIAQQLRGLLEATPPNQALPNINQAKTRAEQRMQELIVLHRQMHRVLPDDLTDIQSILKAQSNQTMRHIQVIVPAEMPLSPWQQALIQHLNQTATPLSPMDVAQLTQAIRPKSSAKTALSHLQQQLFSENAKRKSLDHSLQWLAVRDALEEVEVVAGMIQQALAVDNALSTADIGLLVPAQADYAGFISEVFAKAGLPLSGLPISLGIRDLGYELIHLYLQCRQPGVTPTMTQAALLSLPIMPWPEIYGMAMAQACFDNEDRLWKMVEGLDETEQALAKKLFEPCEDAESLLQDLKSLASVIKNVIPIEGALPVKQRIEVLIENLTPVLIDQISIDWSRLLKLSEPTKLEQPLDANYNQQGIAVFVANEMAWRAVKKLFVLGFSEGLYPKQAAPSSFILEGEKQALNETYGLQWLDAEVLDDFYRQRFLQQLSQASDSVVFTLPQRNLDGEELAPAISLAYQAQLFTGIKEGSDLVLNLDIQNERDRVQGLPKIGDLQLTEPRSLAIQDLAFKRDLLTLRQDENGQPIPESPSSLEKLLVSPLAWLLNHAHIEAKTWGIRELDVMTQGSIAHRVFEYLFVAGDDIPHERIVFQKVSGLLNEAIEEIASFLNTSEWRLEKILLKQEIMLAAWHWQKVLHGTGAKIIANEQTLTGVIFTCPILGKTDCIFKTQGGETIVVDFKKSKANSRIDRMKTGFDLQASLYKEMLLGKDSGLKLKKEQVTLMYYTLNDQTVLSDKNIAGLPGAQVYQDIDNQAKALLKQRLDEVKQGHIKLNLADDTETIEKATGIKPYALEDSPLILKFSHPAGSQ